MKKVASLHKSYYSQKVASYNYSEKKVAWKVTFTFFASCGGSHPSKSWHPRFNTIWIHKSSKKLKLADCFVTCLFTKPLHVNSLSPEIIYKQNHWCTDILYIILHLKLKEKYCFLTSSGMKYRDLLTSDVLVSFCFISENVEFSDMKHKTEMNGSDGGICPHVCNVTQLISFVTSAYCGIPGDELCGWLLRYHRTL